MGEGPHSVVELGKALKRRCYSFQLSRLLLKCGTLMGLCWEMISCGTLTWHEITLNSMLKKTIPLFNQCDLTREKLSAWCQQWQLFNTRSSAFLSKRADLRLGIWRICLIFGLLSCHFYSHYLWQVVLVFPVKQ